MKYDGGKNAAGVAQRIINLIPPHPRYIEGFLGSGCIMRTIRPAKKSVAVEIDPQVFETAREWLNARPGTVGIRGCGMTFLECQAKGGMLNPLDVVYLDPPYLLSTRRRQAEMFAYELTDSDHVRLLTLVRSLSCRVLLSGYPSDLYHDALRGWQHVSYQAMTHRGLATEKLWWNYDPPDTLHDYRFLGRGFHDRQRIKRKIASFVGKLKRMPALERNAVLSAVATHCINLKSDDAP